MEKSKQFLILILGIVAIALLSALILALITWCEDKDNTTKIKYRQFRALQSIAPRKWDLYNGFASYNSDHGGRHAFCFNFVGWLQYRFWRWQSENEKNKAKENKLMEKRIKEWQEDIDTYRERENKGNNDEDIKD